MPPFPVGIRITDLPEIGVAPLAPPVLPFLILHLVTFWNMNSSVLAVWAAQGSKEKKVDLRFSEQLLRVVSWAKKKFFFENVVSSELKSCIK